LRRIAQALLATSLALAAPTARAGDDSTARAYFETGAKEFEKGNFLVAIRAFDQAHALTGRPGLLFSIAQSYKQQYAIDGKAQTLKKALEFYRRYLAEDATGKRRREATQSITDCEALLSRLPPEEATAPAETTMPTQLSIMTQAEGATISVDGAKPKPLEVVEVTPGTHKIVVAAPGYFSEEREVPVRQGQLMAFDVPLREMPARLTIEGRAGAEITIDGRPLGALPLTAPLEIEAGSRFVTVSLNGFNSFTTDLDLSRGQTMSVRADLDRTRQRIASFVLFGAGVAFAGAGVAMAVVAANDGARAKELDDIRRTKYLEQAQLKEYTDYRDAQTSFRNGATAALNVATGLGALAFLLYYFDEPRLTPARKKDALPKPKETSPGLHDMAIAPSAGPGYGGLSLEARF